MKLRAGPFPSSFEEELAEDSVRPPACPVIDHTMELGDALLAMIRTDHRTGTLVSDPVPPQEARLNLLFMFKYTLILF